MCYVVSSTLLTLIMPFLAGWEYSNGNRKTDIFPPSYCEEFEREDGEEPYIKTTSSVTFLMSIATKN